MNAHSNNSLTFEELDYAQQASSISAQILSLESAILAHERRAIEVGKYTENTRQKMIAQVQRMLERIAE